VSQGCDPRCSTAAVLAAVVVAMAQAPSPQTAPVRVGAVDVVPQRVKGESARYPAAASRAGLTGVVVIDATVDTNGRVTKAEIVDGATTLAEAAALTLGARAQQLRMGDRRKAVSALRCLLEVETCKRVIDAASQTLGRLEPQGRAGQAQDHP
jgi:TonB family protein